MKIIETKVYNFDELSEGAKEKARAWYRENDNFSFHAEYVIEDAKECAKLLGITIERVYYSGFWNQGDGACFEGSYAYMKGAIKAIKQYAPQDATLHRIAKDLQEAQRPAFYRLCANVKQRGHYSHSGCTDIDVYDSDYPNAHYNFSPEPESFEGIREALRDFMDWIYRQLKNEYEFQNSDEVIDENILVNEYTFLEDGTREG